MTTSFPAQFTGPARAPRYQADPELDDEARIQLQDLGWVSLLLCRITLLLTPMALFGAIQDTPTRIPLTLFLGPALGALVMAPRSAILRIQVSVAAFVFLTWIGLSYLWSVAPNETLFTVREQFSPLVGVIIVIGLLPVNETIRWFVRGMKLMVAITVIPLVIDADTRTGIQDGEEIAGWAAWFQSKNQFGRSAVLAFMTFVALDHTKVSRWFAIGVTVVFVIFSSSAAALASSIIFLGLYWWTQRYRSIGAQWSATFAVTSIFAGICTIIATYVAAEFLVNALGRDLTFTGRTRIWEASFDWLEREPLLGYGYKAIFNPIAPEARQIWSDIGFQAANAHNGPLDLALSAGIPALFLFMVLYVSTFAAALRHLRDHPIAAWVFSFLILQQIVGIAEPVFTDDWLGPLVIGRTILLKVGHDKKQRELARDKWADDLAESVDLDAAWEDIEVART